MSTWAPAAGRTVQRGCEPRAIKSPPKRAARMIPRAPILAQAVGFSITLRHRLALASSDHTGLPTFPIRLPGESRDPPGRRTSARGVDPAFRREDNLFSRFGRERAAAARVRCYSLRPHPNPPPLAGEGDRRDSGGRVGAEGDPLFVAEVRRRFGAE